MPCEILIKADQHASGVVGYEHPDPNKDKSGVFKKGYPVTIKKYPHGGWGYMECYPYFVQVRVTDGDITDVESLISSNFGGHSIVQEWTRKLDFSTVNNDPVIDGWRIDVSATNPGANNYAGITQEMVETYLSRWNASVVAFTENNVRFDVAIFEDGDSNPGAIQSQGFWGVDPIGVIFTEIDYDQGTGIHTVEADYSGTGFTSDQVESRIEARNANIISNTSGVVTFDVSRVNVFKWFQEEVKTALETVIYRRQFRVDTSTVDYIVSNGVKTTVSHSKGDRDYYTLEVTLAQLQTYLLNRLDETI